MTAGIVSALDRQIPGTAAEGRALVDLIQVLRRTEPGQQVPLAIVRGGQRQEMTVTVGSMSR